jgi:DNA-binding NtrC family response regulator
MADKIEQIAAKTEKDLILRALNHCDNHRQAAADLLGISRKSLHNKMVKYDLFDGKNG